MYIPIDGLLNMKLNFCLSELFVYIRTHRIIHDGQSGLQPHSVGKRAWLGIFWKQHAVD